MNVSDVLFDAAAKIRSCLEPPSIYVGEELARIMRVLEEIEELRAWLDRPPDPAD